MTERIGRTPEAEFSTRDVDHILRDSAAQREGISRTVERLGDRMDDAFNWRSQAARHPYLAVVAAAGVGFWIARLLQPRPTPARRVLNRLRQTLVEIAEGVSGSTTERPPDRVAPTPLKTLLGTAVVRAAMDVLRQRVIDAVPAGRAPSHDT